jgi:cystathionine beta-lyase family protein involved in aluminum resistance
MKMSNIATDLIKEVSHPAPDVESILPVIDDIIKKINSDLIIFVDNCYGEFVEKREPLECGATLIAGSLIKNVGGGIAPTGGYIVGNADLISTSINPFAKILLPTSSAY